MYILNIFVVEIIRVRVMVLNADFNAISVEIISYRPMQVIYNINIVIILLEKLII